MKLIFISLFFLAGASLPAFGAVEEKTGYSINQEVSRAIRAVMMEELNRVRQGGPPDSHFV